VRHEVEHVRDVTFGDGLLRSIPKTRNPATILMQQPLDEIASHYRRTKCECRR